MKLLAQVHKDLDAAVAGLNDRSPGTGPPQDLFPTGEDAGPIGKAQRRTSTTSSLHNGGKFASSYSATMRMLQRASA